MSTFIIGDIHGCYQELIELINLIKFDLKKDKIIFVGDLVGRGDKSLEVLDYIMSLGKSAIRVLGNHDLNLIAYYFDLIKYEKQDKGLNKILTHKNAEKYIKWLGNASLLYKNKDKNFVVSHAGIPPIFGINEATNYVDLFNNYKQQHGLYNVIKNLYINRILDWNKCKTLEEKLSYILFGFTKMKYCYSINRLDDQYNDYKEERENGLKPWFKIRKKQIDKLHIYFGHWAALGFYNENNITCCDSACIWGGKLLALKIESNGKYKKY